ncbi:AraC family transcriptional regulator [Enterococcus florum]|uniref:AraC family transcriptional regulator n=1 Tax=Enterococcus florum TaxID=2480627 RepID=A0A4P5PJ17_9ENTE|nr:helix-turn-helix domain-containing protein [Enterococcus florum]GCF93343.1 AraC family transcriptional regulator [Enterococcus florum]
MLSTEAMTAYCEERLFQNNGMLVVAPHPLLKPYIANYTFSDPKMISIDQTVLPTASNTLVYSIDHSHMLNGLRGVNTQPVTIGTFASRFDFLVLIEFHPGGFFPFCGIPQKELLNRGIPFEDLMPLLHQQISQIVSTTKTIACFVSALNEIFLQALEVGSIHPSIPFLLNHIYVSRGRLSSKALAKEIFYSEKHMNRLFQQHVGTTVKTYSRLLRIKFSLEQIKQETALIELAEEHGYYDAAHFSHEFKKIYRLTPHDYLEKMSIFYNDPFKMSTYT